MDLLITSLLAAALAGGEATPAANDAATDPPARVPEILVTARRRVENLQTVPAAASVVDADLLARSYTVNTQQLGQLVPALNYSSANPRNTAVSIRGLGSSVVAVSQANDGLEPGVGFYVDQVYHARPATAAFDMVDLDRIEVLRGPQGTLFGKNTTAGAIHITTRAPSFDWTAQGELSVGEQGFVQARGAVSGPLVADRLAFRLSGLTTQRDGVLHNVRTGADLNTLDNQAVRAQLLFTPTPELSLRLTADWSNFNSACCTQVYYRVGSSLRPAARQYPALAAGIGYAPPSTNVYDRLTDIDAALKVATSEGGVALVADWQLGHATLTSISAWRFWDWDAANDRDYTGLPIQLVQRIPSRQDQISQELRLASNGTGRFAWVVGLYAFRQVITGRPISIYGPAGAYWLIGPTSGGSAVPANLLDGYGQDGRTRFAASSYAGFGEVNWTVLPRLTITAGLRYTYETKNGQYETSVAGGPAITDPALIAARLSVLRPQAYDARDSGGDLSGRANIAWQVRDGVFAYVSLARGFKSGGINMSGLPLDPQGLPVLATAVIRPERNTTWEAGLKTDLFGQRLRLNLAAYRTDVRDFQATIVDSRQTVALRGFLSNIPRVSVQGVEVDATAVPLPGLQLRAALAYADGRYADYPQGPCPLERQGSATTACDLSGGPLPSLPRWATSLGLDYAHRLGHAGEAFIQVDTSWRSSQYGDPTLSRFTLIDGYNLTNASIGFRSRHGWRMALFARNLFNSNYVQNLTTQAGNSGLILATPSDPRLLGVTVGFDL